MFFVTKLASRNRLKQLTKMPVASIANLYDEATAGNQQDMCKARSVINPAKGQSPSSSARLAVPMAAGRCR